MTTLKSLGIVGAVFIVVVAVAAALSLFLRGSPETPTTQAQTAAVDHTPAPDAPATDAASVAASPETPDPSGNPDATDSPPRETPSPSEQAAAAIAPGADPSRPDRDYTIVEILPKNFIPAIRFPYFYDVGQAAALYDDGELVIGLSIGGEHRAYSVPYLSGREIVNDTVGGVKVAVTW